MRLILHPGHGKCGSSTIQRFLKRNLKRLHEHRIGVVNQNLEIGIPRRYEWDTPALFLKEFIIGNQKPNLLKEKLCWLKKNARKKNYEAVILSAENLSNERCYNAQFRIHEAFQNVFEEILIIYYIRRQDEFLLSAWQQWGMKKGLTFPEYVEKSMRTNQPNYLQWIQEFEKIYGKEMLKVGLVNHETLFKGDLLSDFTPKVGLDDGQFEKVSNANVSLHLTYSEVLRRISGHFKDHLDNQIKNLLNRKSTYAKHILFSNRKPSVFFKYSKQIMEYYYEINRRIHAEFFNQYDFEKLFGKEKYCSNSREQDSSDEIDEIKEIIAIQNDLIFGLIAKQEKMEKHVRDLSQEKLMIKLRNILGKY